MSYKLVACGVFAVGATTLAGADIAGMTDMADRQTKYVRSGNVVSPDDSMPDFLTVVASVTEHEAGPNDIQGNHHQKYLGLGFAHGDMVSSGEHQDSVYRQNMLLTGQCHGNGHRKNSHSQQIYSSVTGGDYRDCGDPSPSE